MDRKEAIFRIKDHMEHHGIGKYPHLKLKEALDMAIAALDTTNEPLTCKGCMYAPDCPSEIHCHGCARMYTDHYRHPPEGEV